VVIHIENAIEQKCIALGALLDIERAFNGISFDTIKQAAERHGIKPAVCRCIFSILESRNIGATLSGEILRATTARKCLQGGVLSPLLWNVVDDLLGDLKRMAIIQ
jgi:tRNA threonylcarbamoyladenosine modification (KEOPS) complex Cgi121 subunit